MQTITQKLTNAYEKHLNSDKTKLRYFFAPGRVNLIGEHTDYNGGNVFPCALDIGTYAVASSRSDNRFRLFSLNFSNHSVIEFGLDNLVYNKAHNWANYPKGVIEAFLKEGAKIEHGLDIVYYGNLPNGAGLSSSASIEVLTGTILNSFFNCNFDPVKIALLGQSAENNYIGVGCGIMDQFASAMGMANHAILLDCNTLKYQYSSLNLNKYKLVIGNTNKKRGLADSKYNERLSECKQALQILKQHLNINTLGEASSEDFKKYCHHLTDNNIFRRARHAISENERTLKAVEALNNDDLITFGSLMNQSHISLRDDYEVTGLELDSMVNAAWNHHGCIGSRMTGAGFGGCTVSLVEEASVDSFIEHVKEQYHLITDLDADFYVVKAGQGAREITGQI